ARGSCRSRPPSTPPAPRAPRGPFSRVTNWNASSGCACRDGRRALPSHWRTSECPGWTLSRFPAPILGRLEFEHFLRDVAGTEDLIPPSDMVRYPTQQTRSANRIQSKGIPWSLAIYCELKHPDRNGCVDWEGGGRGTPDAASVFAQERRTTCQTF